MLRAETPTDTRNSLSSHPPGSFPQPIPLTNLLGDGFGHCASCTSHKPQVYSKVTSTLSLLELSCGWQAGWHHFRFTPWKPSGSLPDISPLHSHLPWPCQRPRCPFPRLLQQPGLFCQNHTPHRSCSKSPLVPPAQVTYSAKVAWALTVCVSATVLGARAQSRKQNRQKVLPSWNFHSVGREMVHKVNGISEGDHFMEKRRIVNRNERCRGEGCNSKQEALRRPH